LADALRSSTHKDPFAVKSDVDNPPPGRAALWSRVSSQSRSGARQIDSSGRLFETKNVSDAKKTPLLDLHGFKTDEVFDAVDRFLTRHQNARQVRIMPGKGSGKVKALVLDYLKKANYPWSFERLANGKPNEGVLVIHME
jgi:hypothetical protein